jgi:alpha-beta hydrolase superfamily lysophospholipase
MRVLLVHGLGRSPLSTWGLARFLRRGGHITEHFGYIAAVESFARIRSRLRYRLERLAQFRPYAVVGHSLGGLLLRDAVRELYPEPAHLVMLATPNQAPRLARRVHSFWPYRMVTGQLGQVLSRAEYFASLPVPSIPYTIVAGTAGPRGKWSPFGNEVNDGLLAATETRITKQDPLVLLPVEHTFMMRHPAVHVAVAKALDAVAA